MNLKLHVGEGTLGADLGEAADVVALVEGANRCMHAQLFKIVHVSPAYNLVKTYHDDNSGAYCIHRFC